MSSPLRPTVASSRSASGNVGHDAGAPAPAWSGRVLLLALALLVPAVAASTPAPAAAQRIVAIGDIHGALDALSALLRQVGVVDEELRWSGGDTVVVQTGDYTDRGPEVRAVIELLMRLEEEADDAGGRFEVLLANHEAFNFVGFLRDTTPADFEAFVTPDSEERRRAALERWREFRERRAEELDRPGEAPDEAAVASWLEAHPPGFVERMEAFGPDGRYGRWLRERRTAVEVDDVLFLHGGISPTLAGWDPDRINRRIWNEMETFDRLKEWLVDEGLALPFFNYEELVVAADEELSRLQAAAPEGSDGVRPADEERARDLERMLQTQNWFLLHPDGPLWFRGFAEWTAEEGAPRVDAILDAQGVRHIVVGHTTQLDGTIRERFDGKIFIIDTGMLTEHYEGGRPSALEIVDGHFRAVYPDGEELLWPREPAGSVPSVPAPEVERTTRARGTPPPRPTGVALEVAASARPAAQPTPAALAAPTSDRRPARLQAPQEPQTSVAPASSDGGRVFLGPDGQPLPFTRDEQVLEFLRNAPVVRSEEVGSGITGAKRLTLERDGIRVRGIFHDVDLETEQKRIEDRFFAVFRDSWRSQVAAYVLARLLGIDNVPPTVDRTVNGTRGSLQLWIEGDVMSNADRIRQGLQPPDLVAWLQRDWTMRVFDNLIYNDDRNTGNVLIDQSWNVWMIDHTRAFQRNGELRDPERVSHVERTVWERLLGLTDDDIREALDPWLDLDQMNGLLQRRRRLVTLLQGLIEDREASAVIFDRRPMQAGGAPALSASRP